MSLLAGRGVLLCSTLGRLVLLSAVRIGVYVVLHPLCGDWPSLWSIGPTMFLQVPARHSWPLTLPHHSITSGCSYCRSLQSVFPHVTVLLAHHLFHTEHLTVPVSSDRRSVRKPSYQPTIALDCVARAFRDSDVRRTSRRCLLPQKIQAQEQGICHSCLGQNTLQFFSVPVHCCLMIC